jgi:hypothetical protein
MQGVILSLLLVLAAAETARYEWFPCPDGDPTQLLLFRNGRQVGAWHVMKGYYRALLPDGRWGPKRSSPPIPPPESNFGLDRSKLAGKERYLVAGKEVSRRHVERLLQHAGAGPARGNGRIPDLAGKLRLTVIGDGREQVLKDLDSHPALVGWKERLVIAGYPADHWHLSGAGFVAAGRPTIYVQKASGEVLHRQDDYSDGAAGLALALERAAGRLRKPAPDYDGKADRDERKRLLSWRRPGGIPWSVWAVGGAAIVACLLLRRKQS